MATKCITVTNEAYERLAAYKEPYESFSDVITKLTRSSSLLDLVGVLSHDDAKKLRSHVADVRKRFRERMDHTAKRLQ